MCRTNVIWLIFILTIIYPQYGLSQTYSELKEINWIDNYNINPDNDNNYFYFKEQSGADSETNLPFLFIRYEINPLIPLDSLIINITTVKSENLSFEETLLLKTKNIRIKSNYRKHIVQIQKRSYVELEIFPFVINENGEPSAKITKLHVSVQVPPLTTNVVKSAKKEITSESVLSSGKWIKINAPENGIYKIPYATLRSWGFSNPQAVNIFGNGGTMLPKRNGDDRYDDLQENHILHENDAIFFYSQGSVGWHYDSNKRMYIHQIHDYSNDTYFFLSEDAGVGKRVKNANTEDGTYTNETGLYDSRYFHEVEEDNYIKSGRTWYGETFNKSQYPNRNFNFTFNELDPSYPVKLHTDVIARSPETSEFNIYINDSSVPVQTISIPSVSLSDNTGSWAKAGVSNSQFYISSNDLSVLINYDAPSPDSRGFLNFLTINAKEKITLKNKDFLTFRNMEVVDDNNISKFNISDINTNTEVWDVTDHTAPKRLKLDINNNNASFITSTSILKEFIAFNKNASFNTPSFVEQISNQNLHGLEAPDMLIITHEDFMSEAMRLANIHFEHSQLTTEIITPELIYNEFSSGKPDVSALRDFVKFLYLKDSNLKYLLLLGDGSYDNRSNDDDNTNKILTYQSVNSISFRESYSTDDFYGFLDENEGINLKFNKLDIGIGRLCVNTKEEASSVIDKIESYLYNQHKSTWRTKTTFVADDGDNNTHVRDADLLTQKVDKNHPEYEINKIYLDAYPKITAAGGTLSPDVNAAIDDAISEGTLIFNYTGHGGETGLAHEKILTIPQIEAWTNHDRLPLFVTATCEFSRYDDKDLFSAGEHVLLNPNGGAFSLLTTTRIAWSNQNYNLNNNLYNHIFEKDSNGKKLRLGDIIRLTKNATPNTVNKLNFTLLGDPAVQLNYPNNQIITTTIVETESGEKMDTLKALSNITISGKVINSDNDGIMLNNGTASIKVFDKAINVQTLGNEGQTPFEYKSYENRIFTGDVKVIDSTFQASFIVPKDIRYNVDYGKISFYCMDDDEVDAFGANNLIKIGGMTKTPPVDNQGPEISCKINDSKYYKGITTSSNPILSFELYDENGINTSSAGIGHDLTLVINDNRTSTIVLNNYYKTSKDTYQKGSLSYQLKGLEDGKHTLTFKAWDNLNNSSTIQMDIEVASKGDLKTSNSKVTPNPIESGLPVDINFEHNAPNELINMNISLYSLDGKLIDNQQASAISSGIAINPLSYTTPSSLSSGIYVLRCECESASGLKGQFSKKIVIIK